MLPTYIILPTSAFGGAEKRFLGLFVGLARECSWLRLVASRELVDLARGTAEFALLNQLDADQVITFSHGSLPRTLARCFERAPRAIFHYVLVPPPLVQRFPTRRIVFTVPLSGVNLYNRTGRWSLYAGALTAARTDFLDRTVHDHFAHRFPFLRRRFSVTPGSFVDTEHYQRVEARQKGDVVAFLGLFSEEKQAFRVVESLAQVADILARRGRPRVAFRFYGRECRDPSLASCIARLAPNVDVATSFQDDPRAALAQAKVFLSLQRNTNYPSKSLLEALSCGLLPVITDVGDSARMVPAGVAEWVPRDFSAHQLAHAIGELLDLSADAHDARIARARDHLEAYFSFGGMAAYYTDLWRSVA